jgi:hypothetical protein
MNFLMFMNLSRSISSVRKIIYGPVACYVPVAVGM